VVTAESLKSVEFGDYENTTVESVARTDLHSVDIQTSAFDALSDLMSRRYETAIVQRDGAPIGVVSREDFTALLDLRRDTVPF
jgi:signal-transduction protein with cAMP-binding, CBS, and nucleotidyltransferase domain